MSEQLESEQLESEKLVSDQLVSEQLVSDRVELHRIISYNEILSPSTNRKERIQNTKNNMRTSSKSQKVHKDISAQDWSICNELKLLQIDGIN